MCIWKVLTDEVIANGGKNNEPLIKWWCYATSLQPIAMEKTKWWFPAIIYSMRGKTLTAVGISKEKVDACIASSGGVASTCSGSNCRNTMLEQEILDRSNYGIITLPTIVVNGVVLRGESESSGAAEALAARAICRAFALGFNQKYAIDGSTLATSNGAGQGQYRSPRRWHPPQTTKLFTIQKWQYASFQRWA